VGAEQSTFFAWADVSQGAHMDALTPMAPCIHAFCSFSLLFSHLHAISFLYSSKLDNGACLSIELTFDNSDFRTPPRVTDAALMFGTTLSSKTITKLPENEHGCCVHSQAEG
jgi:hypothetical protein